MLIINRNKMSFKTSFCYAHVNCLWFKCDPHSDKITIVIEDDILGIRSFIISYGTSNKK